MITAFQTMIRRKTEHGFQPWLMQATQSLLASFANDIAEDQAVVLAAITSPWSSGQVEGQLTKLKMIKRQMHGRQAGPARNTPGSGLMISLHQTCLRANLPRRSRVNFGI